MTNDGEHLSMFLLAICISSLKNIYSSPLPIIKWDCLYCESIFLTGPCFQPRLSCMLVRKAERLNFTSLTAKAPVRRTNLSWTMLLPCTALLPSAAILSLLHHLGTEWPDIHLMHRCKRNLVKAWSLLKESLMEGRLWLISWNKASNPPLLLNYNYIKEF